MTVNEGSSSTQPLGFCVFLNNLGASFLVLQLYYKLKLQGTCWLSMLLRGKTRKEIGSIFRIARLIQWVACFGQTALKTWLLWTLIACVHAQRAGTVRSGGGDHAGTQFLFTFSAESNRAQQGTLLARERGVITVAWVPWASGSWGQGTNSRFWVLWAPLLPGHGFCPLWNWSRLGVSFEVTGCSARASPVTANQAE